MNWKVKTAIVISVLVFVSVFVLILKIQYDTIQKLKTIETSIVESKDIGNDLKRAQSSYTTKEDIERLIKQYDINIDDIRNDLQKLDGEINGVNTVVVRSSGFSKTDLPSTEKTPSTDPLKPFKDDYGYWTNTQWYVLTEPFDNGTSLPIGKAGFSAWKENPWTIQVQPRLYSATTVLGEDEDGRYYAYSQFTIEVDGKKYKVPVHEAKIVQEAPGSKFRFDPHVYMAVDGGLIANPPSHAEVTPSLGVSLFSYGRTKSFPSFTFLGLGAGYATQTKAPVISIAPVNYNVGDHLPLIRNLYVGPSVSLDVNSNIGVYLGVKVGL